jgi:hypothetical protein
MPGVEIGDALPVLESAKHGLYEATALVSALVVPDRFVARSLTWDARLDAAGVESL